MTPPKEEKATSTDLKIERQKFQLHKKGYEDITKAITDLKEVEKPEIQKVELVSGEEDQLATAFFSMLKGKPGTPGKDGHTPTKEELIPIIKPLIPAPIKGDDYVLTDKDKQEIADSITVPIVEKIIEKTETIIEKPITIDKTVTIDKTITEVKEVAKYEDADVIANKLLSIKKAWFPIDSVDGLRESLARKSSGGGSANSLRALIDVDYSGLSMDSQGRYVLGSGGGGSGTPGGSSGDLQWNNAGSFDGFGTFNSGTNQLDLTGISLISAGVTTTGLFIQSGDQATFDVAGSSFAVKTTAYNSWGLIYTDNTGLVTIGDYFGDANATGIAIDDTATTIDYSATGGHTFTGNVGIGTTASATNKLVLADTVLAGSGSLAGSLWSGTQTWNTTGTPTAWKLNVTDTASNAASLLADLQVGGVSMFSVSKAGNIVTANGTINTGSGAITTTGNVTGNSWLGSTSVRAGAAGVFYWNGSTQIQSPSNGVITLWNAANTDFSRLQLGGTTSSFPAIKRSSATVAFRLADDSAPAAISAAGATLSGATTIADTVSAGSGALAGSVLSITQTWNTSGTPTAWKLNVTDTASNAASLLMDLQVGGVSMFKVSKGGAITTNNAAINTGSGAITTTGNVTGNSYLGLGAVRAGVASIFYWNGSTQMQSPSNGVITLWNAANTDFSRLQLGGTTSSFPALKRSTTTLQAVLADDSGFAGFQTLYSRFGSGSPESSVTAPIGAIYHRTDGGAGTSFYVKESGTGNTGWVAK